MSLFSLIFHLPLLCVPRLLPSFLPLQYEKLRVGGGGGGGRLRAGSLLTYIIISLCKRHVCKYLRCLRRLQFQHLALPHCILIEFCVVGIYIAGQNGPDNESVQPSHVVSFSSVGSLVCSVDLHLQVWL